MKEKIRRFLKRELCLGNLLIAAVIYGIYYVGTYGIFDHPNRNLAAICGLLLILFVLVVVKYENQYSRGK
jgi:hypothetical protein